jgi:hypothetical protein
MATNTTPEAARVALDLASKVVANFDPAVVVVLRSEMDQMAAAYAEPGANERTEGAVAAFASIRGTAQALSPELWTLIEQTATLGFIFSLEALK